MTEHTLRVDSLLVEHTMTCESCGSCFGMYVHLKDWVKLDKHIKSGSVACQRCGEPLNHAPPKSSIILLDN